MHELKTSGDRTHVSLETFEGHRLFVLVLSCIWLTSITLGCSQFDLAYKGGGLFEIRLRFITVLATSSAEQPQSEFGPTELCSASTEFRGCEDKLSTTNGIPVFNVVPSTLSRPLLR